MSNELAVFSPVEAMMAEYAAENEKLVFNYRDPAENKLARSHVHKLRGVKTKIADVHKAAKAEALEVCRKLDGHKNKLLNQVEEMIAVHNTPLLMIAKEEAEKEAERLRKIKEAEEKAERKRREELERREAELRAKEDAIKAKEKAAEQAARAAERQKQYEADMKRATEEAKARAEAEHKAALEAAERKRLADIEALKAKAKAEAEAKELEERRKAEKERKRQENQRHRAHVEGQIAGALEQLSEHGVKALDVNQCDMIVNALTAGTIPHVKIEY
jgi:hypothetical protein